MKITQQMFLDLLYDNKYLDKQCMLNGTRHIQLNISIINKVSKPYYYLDAVFVSKNNELRFLVSDINGDNVKERGFNEIRLQDLSAMYNQIITE